MGRLLEEKLANGQNKTSLLFECRINFTQYKLLPIPQSIPVSSSFCFPPSLSFFHSSYSSSVITLPTSLLLTSVCFSVCIAAFESDSSPSSGPYRQKQNNIVLWREVHSMIWNGCLLETRCLAFSTHKVGTYSKWALIRGGHLFKLGAWCYKYR